MKVILLPGMDGTGILFKPFIEALPGNIDVQVISYPADIKLSYRELVGFVMSQLPEEDFILVGESFSGPIAYQVALHKPENLQSVVFVATFLGAPSKKFLNLSRLIPANLLLKKPIPYFFAKYFLFGSGVSEEIIELFKKTINVVSPAVLSFRLDEMSKLDENQQPCDTRAVYIQATDDKLVQDTCVEAYKKVCTNLNIFRIEGTHFLLQTNPLACAEILENEIRLISSQAI